MKKRRVGEELERCLREPEFGLFLERLRASRPSLWPFRAWEDVREFVQAETTDEAARDGVLAALLQAAQGVERERGSAALLAIFWPDLERMSGRKRAWDAEGPELMQNAIFAFMQAVARIDLAQRVERLRAKLVNDTFHDLHLMYAEEWAHQASTAHFPKETLIEMAGGAESCAYDEIDGHDSCAKTVRLVGACVREGLLSPEDLNLFMVHRVQGVPLDEYAKQAGLTYAAARKRRYRAERFIRVLAKNAKPIISEKRVP